MVTASFQPARRPRLRFRRVELSVIFFASHAFSRTTCRTARYVLMLDGMYCAARSAFGQILVVDPFFDVVPPCGTSERSR